MKQYRLFFSWQSDRKDTKRIIKVALKTAKANLLKEGIELIVDEDTRERVGKRNIDAEVLEKIRKCDIFLADLTPVITYFPPKESHDLPKHLPNSNVMYEYGYAFHAKGEKRMIVLAALNKEKDEHIEYMPFDINHDTITLFKDENSLGDLHKWVKNIIEDVDLERAAFVPEYACAMRFHTSEGFTDTITIKPRYRRISYLSKKAKTDVTDETKESAAAELISDSFNKMRQATMQRFNFAPTSVLTVKPMKKTTKMSFAPIRLLFVNQGNTALDNLNILISPSDSRVTFANTNEEDSWGFPNILRDTDTFARDMGVSQKVVTLNPQDSYFFDEVFVHAPHDIGSFKLLWHLNSRSFNDNGELTINVEPQYNNITCENDELAGTEEVKDLEEFE